MKAHDIALAVKLCKASAENMPNQMELAKSLHVSQSEISDGIKRLIASKLLSGDKKYMYQKSFFEYLVYGARYQFPAEIGRPMQGLPTAYSNPIYSQKIISDYNLVWPIDGLENAIMGNSVKPLYPNLPIACIHDSDLYSVFSAFDMLRLGKTRERILGIEELEKQLL